MGIRDKPGYAGRHEDDPWQDGQELKSLRGYTRRQLVVLQFEAPRPNQPVARSYALLFCAAMPKDELTVQLFKIAPGLA